MTESRPPDSEPRPPSGDGDDTPGLVEGVREGVEHVVEEVREGVEHVVDEVREEVEELHEKIEEAVEEHLPRRVRWTAGRIAWLILGSLVALVLLAVGGGLVYLGRHTVWAAGELTRQLNQVLAQHSNLVLEVHDLEGNPFKQVKLIRPQLRLRGHNGPPLLEAPSMTVAYAPLSLWLGKRQSIEVTLDRPYMHLTRGADGRLVLPEWHSVPSTGGGGREIEVLVRMREGTFRTPDTALDITNWNLEGRFRSGAHAQVLVPSMTWSRGPYGSVLQAFAADASVGDSVRIRVVRLRTGDLSLSGNAAWRTGASRSTEIVQRNVHIDVERVRWAWLARVFDNDTFDVPGEAAGQIDAVGDRSWRGAVAAAGSWDSVAVKGDGRFAWAGGRLRMTPVRLASAAGDLDGRLDYTADAWELDGGVTHGDPARWRFLGLDDWPAGKLDGRMIFRTHRVGKDHASRLDAALLPSELGGWRADSAAVAVEWPVGSPDTFAVTMSRRGGTFRLFGRVEPGGWQGRYELARYPLDEWEDGRKSGLRGLLTSGAGTVASRPEGLMVTGALEGLAGDWLGIHTARWRLAELRGRLLPTPDLHIVTRLHDLVFLGVHFDSALAQVRLGDRAASLDSIAAQGGDTLVTAAGLSTWNDAGWNVRLDRARAESRQFRWDAVPPLELAGDPHGVSFQRFEGRDGDAHVTIAGHWAAAGGRYDWTAKAERLDLARLGLPEAWELAGRATATLTVDGPAGDPHWRLEGDASGAGMNGHRLESLAGVIEGGPARVTVRELHARVGGGRADARLELADIPAPWPDTLTAAGITAWLARSGRWSGEAHADSLPLEGLERLAPAARGWAGRLGGHLVVGGRPSRPEVTLEAEARPLRWDSLGVDHATIRARAHDDRFEVAELRLERGDALTSVTGAMPLRLDLTRRAEIPDQPMSWTIEVAKGDLALAPALMPQVAQARGRIDGSARVGGTARHPTLEGTAHLRDGVLVPAGREEVFEGVLADVRLDQTHVFLDTLYAREGRRGEVTGHGRLDLEGSVLKGYRFDLALREFTVIESGFYVAQVNGRVAVTDGPKVNGHTLPNISGDVELERGVVVFDFANQAEQERLASTTEPLLWTYRIHMLANNNLRWQPPDGDIEFSADLTLEQTPGALAIYGDMHGLRGTYHFLSNRFTVSKADLTFDNVGGVNPTIDAEASTRITPSLATAEPLGQKADSPGPHTVTVRIQGRSDRPDISFATDPDDWDTERVLRELTVGRFIEGSNVTLGDPLDNYITRKLNEQLDPLLSKVFLGYVNQWTLAREQGGVFYGQGDLFLKVSSQVSPQLLVSYSQKLPGFARPYAASYTPAANALERNVEAEYRLNRFFYVTTGFAQRRNLNTTLNPGAVGAEFDVNLKARWEY